jgi:hypothetical protein
MLKRIGAEPPTVRAPARWDKFEGRVPASAFYGEDFNLLTCPRGGVLTLPEWGSHIFRREAHPGRTVNPPFLSEVSSGKSARGRGVIHRNPSLGGESRRIERGLDCLRSRSFPKGSVAVGPQGCGNSPPVPRRPRTCPHIAPRSRHRSIWGT